MAQLKYIAPLLSQVDFENLEADANYVVKVDGTDTVFNFTTSSTGIPVTTSPDVYNWNGKLLNTYAKLLTGANISGTSTNRGNFQFVIGSVGDSVSGYKFSALIQKFEEKFGLSGAYMFPSTGSSFAVTGDISGNPDGVMNTSVWFNGGWITMNGNGATITAGIGRTLSTQQAVIYQKSPTAGTFKIQLSTDGNNYTDALTVNANGTEVSSEVAYVDVPLDKYQVRVVKVSGGSIHIIGVVQKNLAPGFTGVAICNLGVGGLNWVNINVDAAEHKKWTRVFTYLGIDLLLMEFKEVAAVDIPNKVEPFLQSVKTAAPKTDFLFCGTTPDPHSPTEIKHQNTLSKIMCLKRGWAYFDSEGPLVSADILTSIGWIGDGTHTAAQTGFYLGGVIWKQLGIDDLPLMGNAIGLMPGGYHPTLKNFRKLHFENFDNDNRAFGWIGAQGPGEDLFIGVRRWLAVCNIDNPGEIHFWFDPNEGLKMRADKGYGWENGPFLLKLDNDTAALFGSSNRQNLKNLIVNALQANALKLTGVQEVDDLLTVLALDANGNVVKTTLDLSGSGGGGGTGTGDVEADGNFSLNHFPFATGAKEITTTNSPIGFDDTHLHLGRKLKVHSGLDEVDAFGSEIVGLDNGGGKALTKTGIMVRQNGNIGVGLPAGDVPQAKFHLNGVALISALQLSDALGVPNVFGGFLMARTAGGNLISSDIIVKDNGNGVLHVGIGDDNPQSKFSVVGDTKISGNTQVGSLSMLSIDIVTNPTFGAYLMARQEGEGGVIKRSSWLFRDNGRMGANGVSQPDEAFHIAGKVKADGFVHTAALPTTTNPTKLVARDSVTGELVEGAASGGGGTGESVWNTNGNNAYYNDGNVGIGESSPEFPLEIHKGDQFYKFKPNVDNNGYSWLEVPEGNSVIGSGMGDNVFFGGYVWLAHVETPGFFTSGSQRHDLVLQNVRGRILLSVSQGEAENTIERDGTLTTKGFQIKGNGAAAGYVWTATGTDGKGTWAAPVGGSSNLDITNNGDVILVPDGGSSKLMLNSTLVIENPEDIPQHDAALALQGMLNRHVNVATYADMLALPVPKQTTVYKVNADEQNEGLTMIYQRWPDGDLILMAATKIN